MSDNGEAKRKIFNSNLAILKPPEPHFKGEWPKKPPFWRIHGTGAAKNYWKIMGGLSVLTCFLSAGTYYIQPKISTGLFDRYFTPELFLPENERDEHVRQHYERLSRNGIFDQHFLREGAFDETTKEYRERLDSLETALASTKVFRAPV